MAWVLPTSTADPSNHWSNEALAIDGDVDTYAWNDVTPTGWGGYIYVYHSSLYCDKVGYIPHKYGNLTAIDIDIYNDGISSWVNLYEGDMVNATWTEKDIIPNLNISSIRFRYYRIGSTTKAALWELQFGAVPGWTGKISGVTNPAKIMGVDVANISKVKGVAAA